MAENVLSAYGLLGNLINAYPELQTVFDLIKAGDNTQAELEFYKTNYFKNLTDTAKTRTKERTSQPGVYSQKLDAYKAEQRIRLTAKGATVDDATLQEAYDKGLTDTQLDANVLIKSTGKPLGGETLGSVIDLQTYASTYGVSNLFNKAYWDGQSSRLFAGQTTAEDIKAEIKNLAISTFPAYADGFSKNLSLYQQASNVTQTIATYLEKDADTINFDSPVARKIAQYVDPTTGKPAIMPQWMVEKTVKSEPEWAFTNNARNTFDSLTYTVGKDMGLI